MLRSLGTPLVRGMAVALALAAVGADAQTLGPGAEEVRACLERNVPSSARQRLLLQRTDRGGNERTLEATVWWKRGPEGQARFLARVDAPASERGTAFLLVENARGGNLWSYLPEVRAVRRITGRAVSGSFFASDFTYEDVARLRGEAPHARLERLPDAEVEGRPVYVLAGVPTPGSRSAYGRIVSFVDRETCVVLRAELDAPSGEPLKALRVAWPDVERQGAHWRARRVSMRNLVDGSESVLVFEENDWNAEIPDRRFHPAELPRAW